jgi:uncharacterized delta-60 repeat protein
VAGRIPTGVGGALVLVLVFALLGPTSPAAGAAAAPPAGQPARIDTSFGGGFVTHSFSDIDDEVAAVAVQPDGAVVVAGQTGRDRFDNIVGDILVARYSAAGRLDPTFGTDGTVTVGAPGQWDEATAVGLQPDGKIVVAGRLNGSMTVLRLTADGRLDPDFHVGIGPLGVSAGIGITAMAIQPDGKILVTGSPFAVGRLNTDGTVDPTFGTDGFTLTPTDPSDPQRQPPKYLYYAMALQPDGKVLVGGSSDGPTFGAPAEYAAVSRYTSSGQLDSTFGTNGTVETNLDNDYINGGNRIDALALQADGGIVVAGQEYTYSTGGFTLRSANGFTSVLRYTADGRLDPTFSGDGKVLTRVPHLPGPTAKVTAPGESTLLTMPETRSYAKSVAVGPDGSIYVAGEAKDLDNRAVVMRYTSAGLVDTTFGRGGQIIAGTPGVATATAMQADGRLVVAGYARTGDNLPGHWRDVMVGRIDPGSSVGSVWTWGWNATGGLGDGTRADHATPVAVPGLTKVVAVSAGAYHTLALRGDGTVWAWGMNVFGELGDGTTVDRLLPVQVPGLTGVVGLAAGGLHSLAVRGDGTVWAWGWNGFGQLGDGTVQTRTSPVQVPGLAGMDAVSAGLYHSVATREDGWALGWGYNAVGQVGDATTVDRHSPSWMPMNFPPQAREQISAGPLHTLALTAYGAVDGWGFGGQSQMGMSKETRLQPSPVLGDSIDGVSAGWYHSLAVKVNGTVMATGWNALGQLGDGKLVDHPWAPVPGLAGVQSVGAGGIHSLAVTADHRLYAWGWNYYGQLGTGGPAVAYSPVLVGSLTNVVAASAGFVHSVAIRI